MTSPKMTIPEFRAHLVAQIVDYQEKLCNELLYSEAAPNLTLWTEEAELRDSIRKEVQFLERVCQTLIPTTGGKET